MKKFYLLFGFITLLLLLLSINLKAQNGPVMYFCENYGKNGEESISDIFTTGYLTIMVKSDHALGLRDVIIEFDKYNSNSSKFEFYKTFDYSVTPDMDYIFFSGDQLSFDSPGIYRVSLLDNNKKHITSALLEIIR